MTKYVVLVVAVCLACVSFASWLYQAKVSQALRLMLVMLRKVGGTVAALRGDARYCYSKLASSSSPAAHSCAGNQRQRSPRSSKRPYSGDRSIGDTIPWR